jgi:hypothetical protein
VSTRRLIVLFAPGSVEAEISKTQNALFDAHGLASAVALPPMIPVGFVREGDAEERFLALESEGLWESLRGVVGESDGDPFPVAEGFILGCWDAAEKARDVMRSEAPSLKFSSCSAALLILHAAWGGGQWWRELYVEIAGKKPLR